LMASDKKVLAKKLATLRMTGFLNSCTDTELTYISYFFHVSAI
jgi:hypothetical protein